MEQLNYSLDQSGRFGADLQPHRIAVMPAGENILHGIHKILIPFLINAQISISGYTKYSMFFNAEPGEQLICIADDNILYQSPSLVRPLIAGKF